MKATFLFLLVTLLTFSAAAASGNTDGFVAEKSNGDLRAVPSKTIWTPLGVTINKDVLKYGDAWKEAFRSPGTPIPADTHTEYAMDGLFASVNTTIADTAVVYDKDAGRITVINYGATIKTEKSFNPFLVLLVIAFFAMIASNVGVAYGLHKRVNNVNDDNAFIFAFAAFVFAAVAAFAAAFAAIVVSIFFAAVAVIAAFAAVAVIAVAVFVNAATYGEKTAYVISSAVFYCALVAAVVAAYV